mmetsp:Transcript_65384/g.147508  ORF Transcript_65384/g.147508 Transcript_65384/m.147508 type:complete len:96 (+) Transcript_65384:187-474(+)
MVHKGGARSKELMAAKGVTEALVPAALVPHKPKLLANAKTNNYLLNALMAMAAEDRGGNLGIGVDEDGFISEQAIYPPSLLVQIRTRLEFGWSAT